MKIDIILCGVGRTRRLSIIFVAALAFVLCGITQTQAFSPAATPKELQAEEKDTLPSLDEQLAYWAANYSRPDCSMRTSKVVSCDIDNQKKKVTVVMGGGFSEQCFTTEITDTLYERVRSMLPKKAKHYDVSIIAEDHEIEALVPNFFRKGKKDDTRLLRQRYQGNAWTQNLSRPYRATEGLEGRHIALWASHGRYIDQAKGTWRWQRPQLFCTTEDLLSQSIVIPYIIPMLENAGAVVYTPRERDWQTREVVVDNDLPNTDGSYTETQKHPSLTPLWNATPRSGFGHAKALYQSSDAPFSDGSARYAPTVRRKADESVVCWTPDIPDDGRYAVYVSYQTYENSVDDALYTVYHKGGMTEFRVNQKMGGGTWVYLGTFEFAKGEHDSGKVTLTNASASEGIVVADAVRFGGGMGNVFTSIADNDTANMKKRNSVVVKTASGLPRWVEGAKYSAVWNGLPYKKHTEPFALNDYNNDINIRSAAVNCLMGQSLYHPDYNGDGLQVPLDLTVAFHTDAGARADDSFVGTMSIYKTDFKDGKTAAGMDRYVSRDLASTILTNLSADLKKYGWPLRQLRNANYGEAREPMTPVCILEMLSHQNFADMRMAYDPRFKFDFARSVYKSIVKFTATLYGTSYAIQPLPVTDFRITLHESRREATLSWKPQLDPAESTARPTSYIVYTRRGNQGFDNGVVVRGTSCTLKLNPDELYSFKVTALNRGGESFPSEVLSAGIASRSKGTVLVVNAFTRLEGPAEVNTDSVCGFDLDADPGVPYGMFNAYCGRQLHFSRERIGQETGDALGMSGSELEGKAMVGNTFDYAAIHGEGIMQSGSHSFTSCSEAALTDGHVRLGDYGIVDIIYGVQKDFSAATSRLVADYARSGGRLIISAANAGAPAIGGDATGFVDDKSMSVVKGCGLEFSIFREMNEQSYSVPAPTVLQPLDPAFPILTYADGSYAAIAQPRRLVRLGFPLEAIKERDKMRSLMTAFLQFLE